MEKNLFEQAKDMIEDFFSGDDNHHDHHEHEYQEQDKEAIRRTIDAAYHESTPEQQKELEQLKQQLDEKIDIE